MYRWLADAVADGGVVVTASRRLARELRAAFDQQQLDDGRQAWITPQIRFWNDWLDDVLDTNGARDDLPLRIDQHSSMVVWERCLNEHNNQQILNFNSLVRAAMQSWQRVYDWQVPVRELAQAAQTRDQELFASAAWSYQKTLQSRGWTDSSGANALISNLLRGDSVAVPTNLTIAGFDRVPPAVETVLARLRENKCEVAIAPAREPSVDIEVASYRDMTAELRAAGAWARDELQKNPAARLAVISTGLEADATNTVRLIREGLVPGWQLGGESYRTAANVSYGRKLAAYPLIAVALSILRWVTDGLHSRDISVLLRSDFFAGPAGAGRARLELGLRRLPDRIWRPGDLWSVLHEIGQEPDAGRWLESAQALDKLQGIAKQERAPSEWAARIDKLLQELQWPGVESPDSTEFQLINRWRELLNELARTETVQSRITLHAAVARLANIASDSVYQPEQASGVLQVLGTLEVAGMQFDALWVTGMDSTRWPANGNPSALISRSLQRRYGLPDCTPEDTLNYSRRVLRRLVSSAPQAILSWARTEDESELAVTPLLDEYAPGNASNYADPGWHAASFLSCNLVAEEASDPVPAILENEKVAGGAYTVQRQFTEPFSAFAVGRLRVAEIRRIEPGLSASMRGSLVHHALHLLYRECPSLADLKGWSATDVQQRIAVAADQALAPQFKSADAVLRRLLELERSRVEQVLTDFLHAETVRCDFKVAAVEADFDFKRHGVCLKLRLDRMDRLADGSVLIIDYKTGAVRNLLNREKQPADLQLVVYSCAVTAAIGGLALVNIDSRGIDYKAAGGSVEWDKTDPQEWPQRLAAWQGLVDAALTQLASGDVRINLQLAAKDGRPLNLLSRLEEHRRAQ